MALVKICGVKKVAEGVAAARAGADLIGLVFVPRSPRHLRAEDAADLVAEIKQACFDHDYALPHFTGLFVDPGEQLLAEVAPCVSYFQFHGAEDAERVAEMGAAFGMETIKAIGVSTAEDFEGLSDIADAADLLLFDAKPPNGGDLPGGNGVAFDWSSLKSYQHETPFLLAGGLTPNNVGDAIATAKSFQNFHGVDASSGVESAPGVKDIDKVSAFVRAAKTALAEPR